MSAADVVKKFGGQTALSQKIGVNQSAIAYWVKRGTIPAKWHEKLLTLAASGDIPLSPIELISSRHLGDEASVVATNDQVERSSIAPPALAEPSPELPATSQFLFYGAPDGTMKVQVLVKSDTVWTTQRGMAEIFDVDVSTINYHLKNVYQSGELDPGATIGKFPIVQEEGERTVHRSGIEFYNLDVIISIGYRVNSYHATQFRKWATTILREFLIKGFALDDKRLKQGNQLFDKDYFDELLERIRDIRASEKLFSRKINDLYAQCSVDYDKNAPITQHFYAHAQDKLHFAIHGHTSAQLVKLRANANLPNMGVQTFEGNQVTKQEAKIGKNYLYPEELSDLNRLVTMYLDFAETLVRRNSRTKTPIRMQDWIQKLDSFLEFNGYAVLNNLGTVRRDDADHHAIVEFEKYRAMQKMTKGQDFEEVADDIRNKRKLPSETL